MIERRAFAIADAVRLRIRNRTGIPRDMLVCPRERSFMTPCIARDGHLAVCEPPPTWDCVGCNVAVRLLAESEQELRRASAKRKQARK